MSSPVKSLILNDAKLALVALSQFLTLHHGETTLTSLTLSVCLYRAARHGPETLRKRAQCPSWRPAPYSPAGRRPSPRGSRRRLGPDGGGNVAETLPR